MPISPRVACRSAGSTARRMIWPENRCSMFMPSGRASAKRRREKEAGNAAQPWAWMGRSADVVDVRNVSAVIDARLERPPEEELVQRAGAAIRVAADEIDVHFLEVRGRVCPAGKPDLGPVLDMRGEPPLDPVGVRLARTLRPASVRWRRDLA